jgi:hypothetical protein
LIDNTFNPIAGPGSNAPGAAIPTLSEVMLAAVALLLAALGMRSVRRRTHR